MDVNCDAPPYRVVEACAALGFQALLDVRWCQNEETSGREGGQVGRPFWEKFFRKGQPIERNCICGQSLPHSSRTPSRLARKGRPFTSWGSVVSVRPSTGRKNNRLECQKQPSEKPGFLEKPGFWGRFASEKPGFLEKPGFWGS